MSRLLRRSVIELERAWDAFRRMRRRRRPPEHLRIVTYFGHGSAEGTIVRGRVLDNPETPEAVEGESVRDALRQTLARFLTDELPGVPLRVAFGPLRAETVTDREGYFHLRLGPLPHEGASHWARGSIELEQPLPGVDGARTAAVSVRLSTSRASFGIISDVDDTIVHTGAQRLWEMVHRTVTGSPLTRVPLSGAPELYRALAHDEDNPIFYVSSSPWNLHDYLTAFLRRRQFPIGPLLLRDLLGSHAARSHATTKLESIAEVLDLHPGLDFVLIGDSGQHDAEIYSEVVRRHPDRIIAVYIREVRLDPGDGRIELVSDAWDHEVPFVLAADSAVIASHAASLGLIPADAVAAVAAQAATSE